MNCCRTRHLGWSVLGLLVWAPSVLGDVDLELRPESDTVEIGEPVNVGLYAVSSNSDSDEAFGSLQAILQWDPEVLTLLGLDNNGPYVWLISDFMDDSQIDGLNDTFEDGDAFYVGLRNLSSDPVATPDGLLVTTFQFEAVGAAEGSVLYIPKSSGSITVTAVYDDEIPGWPVTGTLGSATVSVSGDELPCEGDANGDGTVDPLDSGFVLSRFGCSVGTGDPNCDIADQNGDGLVDPLDSGFVLARFGDCP